MTPAVHTHSWHDHRHHTGGGFRNVWSEPVSPPFFRSAFWLLRRGLQRRSHEQPALRPIDPAMLREPPDCLRITWIGHSTTLIQTPALTLLTDPMFSERASPIALAGPRREVVLPLRIDDLPSIDAVLVSHDHYDHLDFRSIERLAARDPLFFVPLGVADLVRTWGAQRIVEMDWWQYADFDGARFHCTPARHFSGRGLFNRNGTLWASWYVEFDALGLYYGGDSAMAALFAEIRERLGAPEVALLPIGAYLPRWFMAEVHMTPKDAVQAFTDLGALHLIPIHWGTFDLADDLLHEPPKELRKAAVEAGISGRVHLLDIGESFLWTYPPNGFPLD